MKRKSVEGLPADSPVNVAANDEFVDDSEGYARLSRALTGWDPYDVWRTRVKDSARNREHENTPQR